MLKKSRFALKLRKQPKLITLNLKNSAVYVKTNDILIVETNRGEELGIAVKLPKGCERHGSHEAITIEQILRKATKEDIETNKKVIKEEQNYIQQANIFLKKEKSTIKIITGELPFNQKKLTLFYQNVENNDKKKHQEKPNFKQLSKELYQKFSLPVELREAGIRGEAKVLGGLGSCGQKLCCSSWLHKPRHISIKMAKEQSLPINIMKISGQCGKLMCCLEYELSQYENGKLPDLKAKAPKKDDELLEYAKLFNELK